MKHLQDINLSVYDLPAIGDQRARWTSNRKAALLNLFDDFSIPCFEIEQAWGISPEELGEWRRLLNRFGERGLRITRVKDYRTLERLRSAAR